MAALYANDYQGGAFFELLSATGSNPLERAKITGAKAVEKVRVVVGGGSAVASMPLSQLVALPSVGGTSLYLGSPVGLSASRREAVALGFFDCRPTCLPLDQPLSPPALSPPLRKVYEKEIKSYVFSLSSQGCKLQLPKDEKRMSEPHPLRIPC